MEEYTYDAESNLLKVVDIDPFQIYNKQPKLKYEYRYDAEGNVVYEYKRDSDGVENNVTCADYSYDALNRLTGSTRSQNWYPYETEKKTYAYDTLGNLIRKTGPGKQDVTTYRYNDLNQLVAKEECGYIQSITRIHDYAYTYDKRGNLVKEEEVCAPTTQGPKNITIGAYVYDETNRMVQGANEKGEVSAYTYNGLDVRVGTELILEDNTHGYTDFHCETPSVDTGLVTPEVVKSDYVVDYTRLNIDHRVLMEREVGGYDFRYVYGLDKLQVKVTGEGTDWWGQSVKQCVNLAYVHTDRLGSVTNLTDEFGRVTARSDYGDWGEVRTYESITVDGGFRMLMPEVTFAGHEYDDVLDQFYAKYRFYDADLKRFDSMDPVKGFVTDPMSLVQYLYVKDNPKTRLDPLGLIDPDIALGNLKDRGPEVVLSKGNENNSKAEVKRVQTMLSNLGLYDDKIDGSYGPNTKQAVLTFQKRYGTLDNSGIVDTDTLAFLQRASSSPEANKASLQQENVRVKEERMFASSAATSAKVEQAPKNPYSALMNPMGMDNILLPPKEYNEKLECDKKFDAHYHSFGEWWTEFSSDAVGMWNGFLDSQANWKSRIEWPEDSFDFWYSNLNYYTLGLPEGIRQGFITRHEAYEADPSLYNYLNSVTLGTVEGFGKALFPNKYEIKFFSAEHLLNFAGAAATGVAVGKGIQGIKAAATPEGTTGYLTKEAAKNEMASQAAMAGMEAVDDFVAPDVTFNARHEMTNGIYTIDIEGQNHHTGVSPRPGDSTFLYSVDADKAVLDAAAYADKYDLWVPTSGSGFADSALVKVTDGFVGVTGEKGQLTQWIKVHRTTTNYVHGNPANPPIN